MKRLPWVVAFAVAAIVAVGLRAGGWVPALSAGAGIRWEEAYAAMEAIETNLPDRERLVLANAEVEGPASEGIPVERRLRAAGTLVRVRYEVIGDDGGVARRAPLAGSSPSRLQRRRPGSEFGRIDCPRDCLAQLASSDSVLLARGGQAGIADEWLLRMPVGRAFDLGKRSLTNRAEILLRAGASPDRQDSTGLTPLARALRHPAASGSGPVDTRGRGRAEAFRSDGSAARGSGRECRTRCCRQVSTWRSRRFEPSPSVPCSRWKSASRVVCRNRSRRA